MEYCVLDEHNIVIDIFICDDPKLAFELGGVRALGDCRIGEVYGSLNTQPTYEELQAENALLKAQLQAQTERSDFIEDCIAEMAMQVYAQ